jgi:molybdopterin molybdotransferase
MIAFEKALELVLMNTPVLPSMDKYLKDLHSEILAEDVIALVDLPNFSNSAMDGFALKAEDTASVPAVFQIKGCLKAGDAPVVRIGKAEAVKIMTGAPLPHGADAVVMKEVTEEKEDTVVVLKSAIKGENVRLKGEEIRKGQKALKRGSVLNPAAIGLLAALGRKKARVIRKPNVSLLVTGDELVKPGEKLMPGKIWESNSSVLRAALALIDIDVKNLGQVRDEKSVLERRIDDALRSSDVLLISGGISVGDYDLVQETLLKAGVNRIFWRVAMKPGKPTFFGKKGKVLVFGLPGNPVSALVVFLELVRPALLKMAGYGHIPLLEKEAFLEERLQKKPGRIHFMRGRYHQRNGGYYVKSSGLQNSHILASTAAANCLIILDRERDVFEPQEKVRIQILPWEG